MSLSKGTKRGRSDDDLTLFTLDNSTEQLPPSKRQREEEHQPSSEEHQFLAAADLGFVKEEPQYLTTDDFTSLQESYSKKSAAGTQRRHTDDEVEVVTLDSSPEQQVPPPKRQRAQSHQPSAQNARFLGEKYDFSMFGAGWTGNKMPSKANRATASPLPSPFSGPHNSTRHVPTASHGPSASTGITAVSRRSASTSPSTSPTAAPRPAKTVTCIDLTEEDDKEAQEGGDEEVLGDDEQNDDQEDADSDVEYVKTTSWHYVNALRGPEESEVPVHPSIEEVPEDEQGPMFECDLGGARIARMVRLKNAAIMTADVIPKSQSEAGIAAAAPAEVKPATAGVELPDSDESEDDENIIARGARIAESFVRSTAGLTKGRPRTSPEYAAAAGAIIARFCEARAREELSGDSEEKILKLTERLYNAAIKKLPIPSMMRQTSQEVPAQDNLPGHDSEEQVETPAAPPTNGYGQEVADEFGGGRLTGAPANPYSSVHSGDESDDRDKTVAFSDDEQDPADETLIDSGPTSKLNAEFIGDPQAGTMSFGHEHGETTAPVEQTTDGDEPVRDDKTVAFSDDDQAPEDNTLIDSGPGSQLNAEFIGNPETGTMSFGHEHRDEVPTPAVEQCEDEHQASSSATTTVEKSAEDERIADDIRAFNQAEDERTAEDIRASNQAEYCKLLDSIPRAVPRVKSPGPPAGYTQYVPGYSAVMGTGPAIVWANDAPAPYDYDSVEQSIMEL